MLTTIQRTHEVKEISPAPLAPSLAEYLKTGLAKNEGLLVIATDTTWEALLMELEKSDILAMELMGRGQLVYLNAEKVARAVVPAAGPCYQAFTGVVDSALRRLQGKFKGLRCYGELKEVLCEKGQAAEAVILESFWQEYIASRRA
jgi:hypothetical protein